MRPGTTTPIRPQFRFRVIPTGTTYCVETNWGQTFDGLLWTDLQACKAEMIRQGAEETT